LKKKLIIQKKLHVFKKYSLAILQLIIIQGIIQVNIKIIYSPDFRIVEHDLLNICYLAYYRNKARFLYSQRYHKRIYEKMVDLFYERFPLNGFSEFLQTNATCIGG